MTIARIRSVWTGFTGAPGYTNFHIDVPGVSPTAVTTFWSGVRPWLPNAVTVTPDNGGDLIDEVTGQIQNTWTGTGGSPITGMGGQQRAAAGRRGHHVAHRRRCSWATSPRPHVHCPAGRYGL